MNIGKIVLATTVFGFVVNSALAMEKKLDKMMGQNDWIEVFLQKNGSLRYIDSANSLIKGYDYTFFWTRWKVEKDLTENNFVFCDLSDRRKAVICGTKDKENCKGVEEFFKVKAILAAMPKIYDSEAYDRYGYDCDGYDRDGNSRGGE